MTCVSAENEQEASSDNMTGEEHHLTDSASLLGRTRGVDGGKFPNRSYVDMSWSTIWHHDELALIRQ